MEDRLLVPAVFPDSASFQAMPPVLATGFLVAFIERACLEAVLPHLDPGQQTVGTHVDISHRAATPVGIEITADVEIESVEGRLLWFKVAARDNVELIAEGRHQRAVIETRRFMQRVEGKA